VRQIGSVINAPLKLLGLVPKTPRLPAPLPTPTRDDAIGAIGATDELRRRRGGAADVLMGAGGAEVAPAATGKTTLGS